MRALGLALIVAQGPVPLAWTTAPLAPTVGDTIWVAARVAVPDGWTVRPGRFEASGPVSLLAEPRVDREAGAWLVRYTLVAWEPGSLSVSMPPIWLLGPGGEADSVFGGTAWLGVRSILPDSGSPPSPLPALAPIRNGERSPWFALGALALGCAGATVHLLTRGKSRKDKQMALQPPVEVEPNYEAWVSSGEPKAVAGWASGALRAAIARAVPEAGEGLSTAECLDALERHGDGMPLSETATVLKALDQVGFAAAHGHDVVALAQRARDLARRYAA